MNWFDTTGIANLAKTALKEAQKQIDKALDIKDEDDTAGFTPEGTNMGGARVKMNEPVPSNSERVQKFSVQTMVHSSTLIGEPSSATTANADGTMDKGGSNHAQQAYTLWGSSSGSFFEHPASRSGNITVTKPPASLKRKSFEDSDSKQVPKTSFKEQQTSEYQHESTPVVTSPSGSPSNEKDSSESIEVLSAVTTPKSTITSPGQLSVGGTTHYDGESESIEVLGTLGTTSNVSSPESLTTVDQGTGLFPMQQESIVGNKRSCMAISGLELAGDSPGEHDDDISVEGDSISHTLSEPPITVMETGSPAPITVAPTRTSLHLPLTRTFSAKDVQHGGRNPSEADLAVTTSISSSSTLRHAFSGTDESIESKEMVEEFSGSKSRQLQHEDHDLDQSYETVEVQTHISDSTLSFEEIASSGSVLGGDLEDSVHAPEQDSNRKQPSMDGMKHSTVTITTPSEATLPGEGAGGAHSSGLNSGDDEVETTTSSDIEIISSPNGGDSSSTHSNSVYRTSPLKSRDSKNDDIDILLIKKHRGHARQSSEVSLHSRNSDESSNQPESERLMRRLAEVSETLEQREYRLLELGRQNAELQEQNASLVAQLESKARRAADGGSDFEGYTQRLSALERKFQQSIRDKELLKQQLDALRVEEQHKVARGELNKVLAERDFMISELVKEGEGLSKQVLQHSNIIKRLRAKEKENDSLIRKQRDEIGELVEEAERLKRSLSAKEEVERSQIDAVHKLSSEKQKLERNCVLLKSSLDDHAQRYETLRKSFDFARKELNEQTESYRELQQRSMKLKTIETEHDRVQQVSEQMQAQLEELREQLRRTEHDYRQRLLRVKQEYAELLGRLEATKTRGEEEKNATALMTIPLMKQLESLQNALRNKEQVWEQREAAFVKQLSDALDQSKSNTERDRNQREQIASLQGRIANLEEQLTAALFKAEETQNEMLQKQLDMELLENDLRKQLAVSEDERLVLTGDLLEKERLVDVQRRVAAPLPLSCHTSATTSAPSLSENHLNYHSHTHQQTLAPSIGEDGFNKTTSTDGLAPARENPTVLLATESSPTPSIGNLSLSESLGSIPWGTFQEDETGSLAASNGFGDSMSGAGGPSMSLLNNTTLLETLQATLKQRDGEVHQLQWELSRFQQERNILNAEISNLMMEIESIREKGERSMQLEEEHIELQKRYDALLQMYGEAVEKTEELRLDLIDVKEMYKLQIDDLLRQQRELMTSMNSGQHAPLSL